MTPKQLRFVQAYVETGNATQAYIAAGYKVTGARHNAARLITNDNVKAAIQQAQAKAAERHEYTLDRIAGMLEEDRRDAKAAGQHGAVVSATMGLAKLHGLITDKVENTNRNIGSGERKRRIAELLDRQGRAGIAGASGARARGNGATKPH